MWPRGMNNMGRRFVSNLINLKTILWLMILVTSSLHLTASSL